MLPKLRPVLTGAATFIPGVRQLLLGARESLGLGGAVAARYCYSVWLRHAVLLAANGLWRSPKAVAELGPGDSLGVGLCSLLTGSEAYYAFDVMRFANQRTNLSVLDELLKLFRDREPIPDDVEFPDVTPTLSQYDFPASLFPDDLLARTLSTQRVSEIRASLESPGATDSMIRYQSNWSTVSSQKPRPMDLILSQAALEHVDELAETYSRLYGWLAPDGVMSHAIDFRCHNMFTKWNGHWTVPDFLWKVMRGRRVYLLNRIPYSGHVRLIERAGFRIVGSLKYQLPSLVEHKDLSPRFRSMDPGDLTIGMATIQSEKRPGGSPLELSLLG